LGVDNCFGFRWGETRIDNPVPRTFQTDRPNDIRRLFQRDTRVSNRLSLDVEQPQDGGVVHPRNRIHRDPVCHHIRPKPAITEPFDYQIRQLVGTEAAKVPEFYNKQQFKNLTWSPQVNYFNANKEMIISNIPGTDFAKDLGGFRRDRKKDKCWHFGPKFRTSNRK